MESPTAPEEYFPAIFAGIWAALKVQARFTLES
jgi:hypothetical protein